MRPGTGILADEMELPIEIPESDDALLAECDVQVFHASGPGGQSVNTSDSAVRLKHRPTGITVVARRQRSQLLNKKDALERLRVKLEELNAPPPAARIARRKSRNRRAIELEGKTRRGAVKRLRRPPTGDE
jgi:ribosome-associated protein